MACRSPPPNAMQLPWQRCTHPYTHSHYTRAHKKSEKRRTENWLNVTPVPVRPSSLLSNIIYGFGEINIKNRKGKTTVRTIKNARRKSTGCTGLPPRRPRPVAGGNPSAAALRPALIPAVKGYGV